MKLNLTLICAAVVVMLMTLFAQNSFGQTVQRSTYAVFSPVSDNDSLLVAGGQIMTGESGTDFIEHGYYPLNHSLLNVAEEILDTEYNLYPNPFTDRFTISWNGAGELITIEVYAPSGELINSYRTSQSNFEIDMNAQSSGVYYVKGYTNEGVLFNRKMIKG